MVDACADPLGTNSVAPLFFSAASNILAQVSALAGNDIMINPPFFLAEEFVDVALAAFAQDTSTRCIFIVPNNRHNPRDKATDNLERHPHTRVISWYTPKAKLFLKCRPGDPLNEKRLKADPYNHIIIAWELNLAPAGSDRLKLAKLPDPTKNQISEWKKFA